MPSKPTSALCKGIDVVKRVMSQSNCGICDGKVFKKIADAKYTYVYCSTVKTFLHHILSNIQVADVVAPLLGPINNILSEPSCAIIPPIYFDYNYIEVKPKGTCFDIKGKRFIKNPENLKGSPRAFIDYQYDEGKVPYPKPFIEGKCFISH